MTWRLLAILATVALAWSCGGGEDAGGEDAGATRTQATTSAAPAVHDDRFDRESFVLCPALEEHREELASIVGFEQDAERDLAGLGSECRLRGVDGVSFLTVSLSPAVIRSISMHVGGYQTEPSPAPELGQDAVFIDDTHQPHAVFKLGSLIIDVGAAAVETPSREAMIELATRVRRILAEANG